MKDLTQLGNNFNRYLQRTEHPEATIKGYGVAITQFISFLNKNNVELIDQLKPAHLHDFLSQFKEQDYAAKSISQKINALKIFFDYLKSEKLVTKNLAQDLKHPKYEGKEPRILTEKELKNLRQVVSEDQQYEAIVETLLQTGMRIGELVSLKITDITLNPGPKFGEVRVRKKKELRKIPINNAMEATLEQYLKHRPKSNYQNVFLTKNGKPIPQRNVRRRLTRFFKLAGIINVTVNDLRNTFIAYQLSKGMSVERVAYLVGYKNLSSMNKFQKVLDEQRGVEEEETIEEL